MGDTLITERMFQEEWARRRSNPAVNRAPTEKERMEVLEEMIQQETLWAKARAEGFDQSPEMQSRFRKMVIGAFREARAKVPSVDVAESEVAAYYQSQMSRWTRPAAVRAAAILITVPRTAPASKRQEIRAKAEELAQLAVRSDDAGFVALARQHSEDQATRFRGGELGWMTKESAGRDSTLFDSLMALPKPGVLPTVVETPAGFQIGRLLEKREAGPRPFAEVRELLRHELMVARRNQAEQDFQQSIRRGLVVEVNRDRLVTLELGSPNSPPPSLPVGVSSIGTP